MAKKSREKGKSGEREVAEIIRSYGFDAWREVRNWADDHEDLKHNVAGVHFEVKRQERLDIPAWTRQAREDAPQGVMPVVVYRRSREPWMAVVPFTDLMEMIVMLS